MSGRLGEEAFETPPMSDVQLGAAYDLLEAEGLIGTGLGREEFIAEQSQREMDAIEAELAEAEPIVAPDELRERILERIHVMGGTATGGLL